MEIVFMKQHWQSMPLLITKHMNWYTLHAKLHKEYIKTHGLVSAAKKALWRTSVLFTGTANSPFSTPHISITVVFVAGFVRFVKRLTCTLY